MSKKNKMDSFDSDFANMAAGNEKRFKNVANIIKALTKASSESVILREEENKIHALKLLAELALNLSIESVMAGDIKKDPIAQMRYSLSALEKRCNSSSKTRRGR